MKITATFMFPVYVQVDVPDNATEELQRDALDAALRAAMVDGHPWEDAVLHECSNGDLID